MESIFKPARGRKLSRLAGFNACMYRKYDILQTWYTVQSVCLSAHQSQQGRGKENPKTTDTKKKGKKWFENQKRGNQIIYVIK